MTTTAKYNKLCEEIELMERKLENDKLSKEEKDELQDKIEKAYCELARLDLGWY